jgi:hypothetical protein
MPCFGNLKNDYHVLYSLRSHLWSSGSVQNECWSVGVFRLLRGVGKEANLALRPSTTIQYENIWMGRVVFVIKDERERELRPSSSPCQGHERRYIPCESLPSIRKNPSECVNQKIDNVCWSCVKPFSSLMMEALNLCFASKSIHSDLNLHPNFFWYERRRRGVALLQAPPRKFEIKTSKRPKKDTCDC